MSRKLGDGRITRPLLALGHQVVAVYESPEMTARIAETETIAHRPVQRRQAYSACASPFFSGLASTPASLR